METLFNRIMESFRERTFGGQPVKIVGVEFNPYAVVVLFHDIGSEWELQRQEFPYE